ncbi:MAG: DUF2330 domain-containing protein [Gemmataceae bacterium]
MAARTWLLFSLLAILLVPAFLLCPAPACCPAGRSGKPVVNADQTVIMIWDPDTKMQHFIRQASFKSEADDFGFLVPSPSEPELSESGNEAFPYLLKLTEPETKKVQRPLGGMGCGCGASGVKSGDVKSAANSALPQSVVVLQDKLVAGFQAVVLKASSADALTGWLKDHDYAFSPEVQAWAKPYIDGGWKITALKVAKQKTGEDKKSVNAASLRLSFKTDRPLFPYREPDYKNQTSALGVSNRLLRIYFLAEARYQGELAQEAKWTGEVAWANSIKPEDRQRLLEMLKLPEKTGPAEWWLTEFEDNWPYQIAPADVYFSRASDQNSVKRPPIIRYVSSRMPSDASVFGFAVVLAVPLIVRARRRLWKR